MEIATAVPQESTAKCRRCKRPLTASAAAGIGPRCAAIESALSGLNPDQQAKALEAVADHAVQPTTREGVYAVVSDDGESIYLASVKGPCNCAHGLRAMTVKTCWHPGAARLAAKPVIRSRPEFTVPVLLPAPAPARDVWAELESVGALDTIPAF